jgi:hypothetical protein
MPHVGQPDATRSGLARYSTQALEDWDEQPTCKVNRMTGQRKRRSPQSVRDVDAGRFTLIAPQCSYQWCGSGMHIGQAARFAGEHENGDPNMSGIG